MICQSHKFLLVNFISAAGRCDVMIMLEPGTARTAQRGAARTHLQEGRQLWQLLACFAHHIADGQRAGRALHSLWPRLCLLRLLCRCCCSAACRERTMAASSKRRALRTFQDLFKALVVSDSDPLQRTHSSSCFCFLERGS